MEVTALYTSNRKKRITQHRSKSLYVPKNVDGSCESPDSWLVNISIYFWGINNATSTKFVTAMQMERA